MILLADSGSTKTEWVLMDAGKQVSTFHTQGISPLFMEEATILDIFKTEVYPHISEYHITSVYFYGTGCSAEERKNKVKNPLVQLVNTKEVFVDHDLMAAARALCKDRSGMVAILGTGSNSCLYNGTQIVANVPSLGFVLGDEGSGAHMGKELLRMFVYRELDHAMHEEISETYKLDKEVVLERIYKQPMPGRFAASLVPFIKKHIHHPQMLQLAGDCFDAFLQRQISKYEGYKELPLHVTGSVGFQFRELLEQRAASAGVTIGVVIKQPMEGLIDYHLQHS